MRISFFILIASSIFFTGSCNSFKNKNENQDTTIHQAVKQTIDPGSFNGSSGISFDSNAVQKFLSQKPLFKEFTKDFDTFYRNNNYNYVWYDKKGLIETSGALISAVKNVEQEGVTGNFPYKDTLEQLMLDVSATNNSTPNINVELMLTGEYFYYAKKILAGSISSKADSIKWYLPRKKLSYAALLENNLSKNNIERVDGPVVALQYSGLKNALAHYRDIEKTGEEIVVPSIKTSVLKPKAYSPVVSSIRKRLLQLGYINTSDTSNIYDSNLAGVINQAKENYGLNADSFITNAFIKEINVPAKNRVEQIMVNMERLRWIPADTTSAEFILVNIPEYKLHYFEKNKDVWNCDVVVGKPMTKTVIFSGSMKYVVFSPYWNLPQSIINKEVKPGMRRNKNYLAAHNMEWNGGHVRQKPGPSNSLGLVKFLFPNSNNIYLHDTPSKSLFSEDKRAFSHGCIRVAKPKDLAIRILQQDPQWTPEKIDAAMHSGHEKYVTLKQQIPVYIGYFTAFISNDGQLNFRNDVYQRDASLLNMLMQH